MKQSETSALQILAITGVATALACNGAPATTEGPDAAFVCDANCALELNGSSDYATFGTAAFSPSGRPHTVSFWARPAGPAAGTQVIACLRRDIASGLDVGIADGGFGAWTVYGGDPLVQAPSPVDAGTWHHVAYVLDVTDAGTQVSTLYVDGVSVGTSTASPNNRTPLWAWVGSPDGLSDFYAGDLDELRVWNVARSQAEVREDMNGTTEAGAPGLVAYFDFNSRSGATVPDQSGRGNDMTLGGGDPSASPALVSATLPASP